MANGLLGMYGLLPIDMIKLNKQKLADIYNCSDIDALNYMLPFCEGELSALCNELIELNSTENFDDEYYNGKWKLLNHFGIKTDCCGEAIVDTSI